MKKIKLIFGIAFFCAFSISFFNYWVSQFDWPFIPFLFLTGSLIVWVQKETISYKFLNKLLIGSLLFVFLVNVLMFLRMYVMSRLIYDMPLPLRELWDGDNLILAGVHFFITFLGGLIGIVVKGLYSLYRNRLDPVIVFLGPILVAASSLAVFKIRIGGTIMSASYGFPYPYFIYQIKDVIDNFSIDKWIFIPGSFYHYVLFDYFLYFSIFILFFYFIKFFNNKFKKNINTTFFLFGILIFMMISFTSFMSVKRSYIEHQISGSKYCEKESDCVIIGNVSPFSCAIVTNKDKADKILKLVRSYPSEGELGCSGREKASCVQNRCRVSIDHTSDDFYWEIIKQSIRGCDVYSIMQTHDLEVEATLKDGRIIRAKEPKIDDVFHFAGEYTEKCGELLMMTE